MMEVTQNLTQSNEVTVLRTDAVRAAGYCERLQSLVQQICAIMNEAHAEGLDLTFQVAKDQCGRHFVPSINVVRPL